MGLIAVAIKGGLSENFFWTFHASVSSKNNGEAQGPRAPPLDPPLNCQTNLKEYPDLIAFQIIRNIGRKQNHAESAPESLDYYAGIQK